VKLPFGKPDFTVVTDLYVISGGETAASFYLDNLQLTVPE